MRSTGTFKPLLECHHPWSFDDDIFLSNEVEHPRKRDATYILQDPVKEEIEDENPSKKSRNSM